MKRRLAPRDPASVTRTVFKHAFGHAPTHLVQASARLELAHAQPACLGARLSGHGFGGYTVNLVRWSEADEFCARLEQGFTSATCRTLKTMRCRVVAGARVG